MISKSEAKRRALQSARDKARHQRELAQRLRPALPTTSSATGFLPLQGEEPFGELEVQAMAPRSPPRSDVSFTDQLAELFNNHKLADVEISVGEIVVPAHRLVLCLQSKYFLDALTGGFKEGTQATLQCEPGREHAYLRLLRYLYTGDYEEEPSSLVSSDVDDPELQKHSRVYFLADSLFIFDLKDLALEKFVGALDKLWMSEGLVECITEVYDNTSGADGLRAAVVSIVVKHRKDLLQKPAYEALLSNGGDFAVDLVAALVHATANQY